MKRYSIFFLLLFLATTAAAQNNTPRATGSVWLDVFGGPQGAVIYPQYSWNVNTRAGSIGGYGFLEVAPHELLFTNHLVIYTPPKRWFSIHTETGGIPLRGRRLPRE